MQLEPERPRPRRRLGAVTAGLGLALALALAGCGGPGEADRKVASLGGTGGAGQDGGGSGSATAGKDPEQAALDFARCMRRHGVDMPDPQVDDKGRMTMRLGGGGAGAKPDPKKLQAAQQACDGLLGESVKRDPGELDAKARDAMVEYARCMRQHGVDMPDPTGEGMVFRKGSGQGPDPESSEFQAADRACGHHLDAPGKPGTSEEQP
jgi:hypothetical protein